MKLAKYLQVERPHSPYNLLRLVLLDETKNKVIDILEFERDLCTVCDAVDVLTDMNSDLIKGNLSVLGVDKNPVESDTLSISELVEIVAEQL